MKIFKIIIINIVVIFIIILSVEMYSLKYIWSDTRKLDKTALTTYYNALFHSIPTDKYYDMLYHNPPVKGTFCPAFRTDINVNSDKKPVIFMGCSFTYGDNIKEEETISAQFARLTGRPVYNRACRGWGLAQFLYQAQREDFYTQFPREPEYIIFVAIYDHVNRLDKHKIVPLGQELQPKYKKKGNHLVRVKPKPWDYLFVVQQYQYHKNMRKNRISEELMKLYYTETEAAIRRHWKNTKLVILELGGLGTYYPIFRELENENKYKIILLQDLTDIDINQEQYKVDGWHPSSEVWKIILPPLIKTLGIETR